MHRPSHRSARRATGAALLGLALATAPRTAVAAEITLGQWYTFSFGNTGSFAQSGIGSTPAAPWTFTSLTGVRVRITDGQAPGDAFSLFDAGTLVGSTPVVARVAGGCNGTGPDGCYANPIMSHAAFDLGAGAHALTIRADVSAFGGGQGYFRADGLAAETPVSTVPEPTTWALMGTGIGALGLVRRRVARTSARQVAR